MSKMVPTKTVSKPRPKARKGQTMKAPKSAGLVQKTTPYNTGLSIVPLVPM